MAKSMKDDFTREEMDEIIRTALRNQAPPSERMSRQDLEEIAEAMGVDDGSLDKAVEEFRRDGQMSKARRIWRTNRRNTFLDHLRVYLIVNAGLFIIDMLTAGGPWFQWPMIGWGIGLAFDASDAFFPKKSAINRGALRLIRRAELGGRRLDEVEED